MLPHFLDGIRLECLSEASPGRRRVGKMVARLVVGERYATMEPDRNRQ